MLESIFRTLTDQPRIYCAMNPALLNRLLLILACLLLLSTPGLTQDDATRERRYGLFVQKRIGIHQALQNDVLALTERCRREGLNDAVQQLTEHATHLQTASSQYRPPRMVQLPVSEQLPASEKQWRQQLAIHRTEHAKEMYSAARAALRAGFPSLAFAMVSDVVLIDPDHVIARSILGQQKFVDPGREDDGTYAGEWVSAFEAKMRLGSPPNIYDSRFGWIPASSLTRYEQGLRPWRGDWISDAREQELRRDFRNAWEIRSEHFLIKTNVSLQAGVRMSEQLELFHDWMQQNMAAFFDTTEALQERFEQATLRRSKRLPAPMQVHYFATRNEYQRRVQDKVPSGVETNGLYWQPERTSYFYAKEDQNDLSTLFHEATHQILDSATLKERNLAASVRARRLKLKASSEWILCENSNFWVIEGLACYCESFEIVDGATSAGRPDYVRFDMARQRRLDPAVYFYTPAQPFFALGKNAFQLHPNVSQFYTQASGLVHFMMHYQDGIYRDAFMRLLAAVYRPDPEEVLLEPSFADISGVSFEELDRQYLLHMQDLDAQIQAAGKQP